MQTPGKRSHFRGKPRPGRRVQVQYRAEGGPTIRGVTVNLGLGGAFIETGTPLPTGTMLVVALTLPTAPRPLEVEAEVRWSGLSGPNGHPGMGVKFRGLDVDDVMALSGYFTSLLGAGDDASESD